MVTQTPAPGFAASSKPGAATLTASAMRRLPPANNYSQHSNRRMCIAGAAYLPGSPRPLSEIMAQPSTYMGPLVPSSGSSNSSSSNSAWTQPAPGPAPAAAAAATSPASGSTWQQPSMGLGFQPRPIPGRPAGMRSMSPVEAIGASSSSSSGDNGRYPSRPGSRPGTLHPAAPHPFTSAPIYEAFEPGDSGFNAPTTAEVVTSASNSVMVKISAFFSGQPGDKVLACGGCRALGNWEPDAAPALTWGDGDVWTATLELPPGTHEFKCVALKPDQPLVWEPGNNRRVAVSRPPAPGSSGEAIDLVLGLLEGDESEPHPDAQLVETSGGTTMVKLTTSYTAAFGEYLKVVGGPSELGAWDAGAAPALTWGEGDVWTATLELPAGEHEFKYVVVRQDGRLEWEPGENRRIHVPSPSLAAALAAAKKVAAAQEAAGAAGNDRRSNGTNGRRLTPAEVYQRQESEEQLEPWQHKQKQQHPKQQQQQQHHHHLQQQQQQPSKGHSKNTALHQTPQQQHNTPAVVPVTAAASNGHTPAAAANGASSKQKSAIVSNGWREVKFSTKFAAQFGTYLKAVGSPDQLGNWDQDKAPPLQWSEGNVWSNTLLLPPGEHEFKLVVVHQNGVIEWESGPNRVLQIEPATNKAEQAAGVLHTDCQYGSTDSTSSVWASLDEDKLATAAVEAPHHQQQQQLPPIQPADWYRKPASTPAGAPAPGDAAAVDKAAVDKAAAAPADADTAAEPAKPLQPLDAVVKVFKDRFAQSGPEQEPPASAPVLAEQASDAADETAAAKEQEEQQQHQQQLEQQQPPASRDGGRFASIIAARKSQQCDEPAVVFVDRQHQLDRSQQQSYDSYDSYDSGSEGYDTSSSSSTGGDDGPAGGSRFEAIISARRKQRQPLPTPPWEQHPYEEGGGSGTSSKSRSSNKSSPSAADTPHPPSISYSDGGRERFASQIQRLRQESSVIEHPADTSSRSRKDFDYSSSSRSSSSSSNASSWRMPESLPPNKQPDKEQQESAVALSASAGRFANYIKEKQKAQQQQQWQQQEAATSSSIERDSSSSCPRPSYSNWRSGSSSAVEITQDTSSRSGTEPNSSSNSLRPTYSNWRTESNSATQTSEDSSTSSNIGPSHSNWRTEPTPTAPSQQDDSSSPRPSYSSWKSEPSPAVPSSEDGSTSSGVRPSTPTWQSAVQPQEGSSSSASFGNWQSAPNVEPKSTEDSSSGASNGSNSSSSTAGGDRWSKYSSGYEWRSTAPVQQQQQRPADSAQSAPSSHPLPAAEDAFDAPGGRYLSNGSSSGINYNGNGGRRFRSSWDAVEASGGRGDGADYLFELGQSDYNTNVDAGQNVVMIDSLFTGGTLGQASDIADGSLRGWEARTLNNIIGDYYISPAFMDKVAMHITKNYLCDQAAISNKGKVPLILGIWGPKGCGKTFQTELAFKKLGVEPVVMSAGELESEHAGQPGRLIRERYRKAAELSKTRGKLSCLVINDLDAGVGRFGNTQVTVNNQIVIGTLMNICDDPNHVSIGAGWREGDSIKRVPIIVTGNDFSTLYAPLIRDGRMEKFYWHPDREDVVNIVWQLYKEDGLNRCEIEHLVDTFSNQALDFFGALRAATYDCQIREWMAGVAGAPLWAAAEERIKEVNKRLITQRGLPVFDPVPLTLPALIAEGNRLVWEQEAVNQSNLGEVYMRGVVWGEGAGAGAWGSSEDEE